MFIRSFSLSKAQFNKILPIFLVSTLFVQSLAGAGIAVDHRLNDEKNALLPKNLAEIDETFISESSSKKIYLIQDAHTNPSAQLNISKCILELTRKYGVRDIFIEASFGDSSLRFLRKFSSPGQLKRTALSYLNKGLLQGSELADLTAEEALNLWGVENPDLYEASISAYRDVLKNQESASAAIKLMQRTADDLKKTVFNRELLIFDEMRSAFRDSRISFVKYLSFIEQNAQSHGIDLAGYPVIRHLSELRQEEAAIDFDAAAQQQTEVFGMILRSDSPELEPLRNYIRSARNEKIKRDAAAPFPGLYYAVSDFLNRADNRVESDDLLRYLKYSQSARNLQAGLALDELQSAEYDLLERLIKSPAEQQLFRTGEALYRLGRLIYMEADPEIFREVKNAPELHDPVQITGYLNRAIEDAGTLYDRVIPADPVLSDALRRSVRFYELTFDRDQQMIDQTLARMDISGNKEAVLVVGGFHCPNIKLILKQRDISFVSVIPQVLYETNRQNYERLLTQSSQAFQPASGLIYSSPKWTNAGIRALTFGLHPLENPEHPEQPLIVEFAERITVPEKSGFNAQDVQDEVSRVLNQRRDWAIRTAASRLSIENAMIRIFVDSDGIPISYSVFETPEFSKDHVAVSGEHIDFTGKSGLRKAAEILTILPVAPDYDALIDLLGDSDLTRNYIELLRKLREENQEFFRRGKVTKLKIRSQNQAFTAFLITERLAAGSKEEPRQLIYVVNTNPYGNVNKQNAVILPPSSNPELRIDPSQNIVLRDVKPSYRLQKSNETLYFRRGQAIHEDGIHIALAPFWANQRGSQIIFLEKAGANRLNFYIHQDRTKVSGTKKLRGASDDQAAKWEQPLTIQAGQTVVIRSTLHLSFPQDHPEAIRSMSAEEVERRVNAVLITDRRGREERIPIRLRPGQPDGDSFEYEAELHIPYPGLYQAEVVFSIPGDQLDQVTVVRSGTRDANQAGFKDVVYLGEGESETKASIVALTTDQDRYFSSARRSEIARRLVPLVLNTPEGGTSKTAITLEKIFFDMLGSLVRSGGVMASPDLKFDFDNLEAVEGNPAYGYVWIRDAASFGSALIELYEETNDPDIRQAIEAFRAYIYRATELTGQIDAQRFDVSGEHVPPTSWGHQTDGPGHIAQFLLRYLKTFHSQEPVSPEEVTNRDQAVELLQKTAEYIVNYSQNAHYYVTNLKFLGGTAESDPRAHDYWEVMYGMNLTTDIHFYSVLKELEIALNPDFGYLHNDRLSGLIQQKLQSAKGLTAIEAIADILKIYESDDHNRPSRHLRSQRHVGNYERFLREKPEGIDGVVIGALTMVDHPRYGFDHTKVLATYNVIEAAYQGRDYNLQDSFFWRQLRQRYPLASVWWRHPGDDYNGLFLKAGFGKPTGRGNPWHISIDWPVQYSNRLLNLWLDKGGISVRDDDHLRELSEYLSRQGVDVSSLNLTADTVIRKSDERFGIIARAVFSRIDQTLQLQEELIPSGKSAAEQIDASTGNQRGATALTWSNWQIVLAQLNKRQLEQRLKQGGYLTQSGARLAEADAVSPEDVQPFVLKTVASSPSIARDAAEGQGVLLPLNRDGETRLIQVKINERTASWSEYPYRASGNFAGSGVLDVLPGTEAESGSQDDWRAEALNYRRQEISARKQSAANQLELAEMLKDSLRDTDAFISGLNEAQTAVPIHYEIPLHAFQVKDNRVFEKQILWLMAAIERIRKNKGDQITFELKGLDRLYQYHTDLYFSESSDKEASEAFAEFRRDFLLEAAAKHPDFIFTRPVVKQNRVAIFLPGQGDRKSKDKVNIAIDTIEDQSIPDFYSLFAAGRGLVSDLTLEGARKGFDASASEDISSGTLDFINRRVSEPFKTKTHLFDYTVSDGVEISLTDLNRHRWKLLLAIPFGREIQTFQTMLYTIGISA